jgi:hypothetical protein
MKGFSMSVVFAFALDDALRAELSIAVGTLPVGFSGWVTVTKFFHFSGIQNLLIYSGCQKNVTLFERFFVTTTYTSRQYFDTYFLKAV